MSDETSARDDYRSSLPPDLEAPSSPFFRAWAKFVINHRLLCVLACFAVTGLAVHQIATKLEVDTTTKGFLGRNNPASLTLNELEATFGSDSLMQIIVKGDVFSESFLRRLEALHRELEKVDEELSGEPPPPVETSSTEPASGDDDFGDFGDEEGWGEEEGGSNIDEVISLINVRQTEWRDGGLWVGGLLDEWPSEAELPALRKRVLSDRQLVGQVIGEDGTHTAIIVRAQRMTETDRNTVHAAVEKIVEKHHTDDFQLWLGGPASLDANMFKIMLGDFQRQMGIGMLLIVLILFGLFRHPLGVIGPVLVVVQAALWMIGTMALVGKPMTSISNILPLFLICVGMGDSVHAQSVYRDLRRHGADNLDAIVEAVGSTGVPVFYTTMTTAFGLLSFNAASLGAINDMGIFGALGVSFALLLSLIMLPAVLTLNKRSMLGVAASGKQDLLARMLGACYRATKTETRRKRGLVIGAVFTAVAVYGATTLYVHHDPLEWIPDDYHIKDAFVTVDRELGGASGIALMIEAKEPGGLKSRELMLALEELKAHTDGYVDANHGEIVGTTTGVLDVVRESNRALNGGAQAHYAVPDTQRGVVDMFTMFENSGPEQLRRLATIDMTRGLVNIRVKWLEAAAYEPLMIHVRQGVDKYIDDAFDVRFTGAVFTMFTVIQNLILDLTKSFGLAFFVITFVMILLLRDLKLGLIAMIPNLLPIVAVMGFMGYFDIPIDGANLMLASIGIGVAVDDTIHFLHQFKSHYDLHGDVEAALRHSFDHTGRALFSTSAILTGGFMVFMVSEMANIQNFGKLISLVIVLAAAIDLVFCPALLRTFYKDRAPAAPATAQLA